MCSADVHDLHRFMTQVSQEMASEYQRIFARASEDPGTAGDEGEENWATLLREWLPPQYHVATKGRLIGADGATSPQVDVLVLKPSYPRKLLEKKVWLAGGVAAVFECKTTLKASHITEAVDRAVLVKRLISQRTGSPALELRSPLLYGLLAHSHSWTSPSSQPIENVSSALKLASDKVDHPRLLLDLISVADLATWSEMIMGYWPAKFMPREVQQALGGNWAVSTVTVCAASGAVDQSATFSPIGALIGLVTQSLARTDVSVRDFADYYRSVNLWGAASGQERIWSSSVYSDAVRRRLNGGGVDDVVPWNEWSTVLM